MPDITPEEAFLLEAARYFEKRPTNGEDLSYWSNVYNAENCRQAAALIKSQAEQIARLREALESIVGSMADDAAADRLNWGHAQDALDTARQALQTEGE